MSGGSRYIYGRHPVGEALRARPREVQRLFVASGRGERLSDILRVAERHGITVAAVSKHALEELVGDVPHQGIVAAVVAFTYVDIDDVVQEVLQKGEAPLIVALDQVQDPHNLGSLVRSAFALGAHGLLMPKDNSCEVTPTVVKSSAGATAHLPIARVTNLRRALEELKRAGLWVVGAAAGQGRAPWEVDFTSPTVLVIGSEGWGLRRLIGESCDLLVQIPMPGPLGSLNASVAGGVLLYEACRQRGGQR
jgi:23S rRNA (guanosine2251-2'-O)-methyltransferase